MAFSHECVSAENLLELISLSVLSIDSRCASEVSHTMIWRPVSIVTSSIGSYNRFTWASKTICSVSLIEVTVGGLTVVSQYTETEGGTGNGE